MKNQFNFELDQSEDPGTESVIFKQDSMPAIDDPDFEKIFHQSSASTQSVGFESLLPGFVVISNSVGKIVDHLQADSDRSEIFELVEYLDVNFPENQPHSAWICNGMFERLT